ncbi:hypothetical protein [Frankia sp. Cas4]|uniref:hypothetical protein n=1 Tax=Frankia sp. Cas4 TaxID=3073927 RepID=UPI002AD5839A|nr:hypothetical protein [Frankia sp. Cas4]
MATAARDRLARTLHGDAKAAFSVELTARTDELSLDIEGFGPVTFPGKHSGSLLMLLWVVGL